MPTTSKENYLKALFHLQDNEGNISLTQLSEALCLSKASANNMVKKLEKKGWVKYEKYQPIRLTKEGLIQAGLVIRKHRLAEMFLTQIMNFGWEEVHEIAEEMEHVDSPKLFNRMDELLGHPKFDPHGSPIPNRNGEVMSTNFKSLAEMELEKPVRLTALKQSEKDFLLFLTKKNIQLGDRLLITDKEHFDGSMMVSINEKAPIQLSAQVCESLLVE